MPPLCDCHKAPMRWNKSGRYKIGGFWKCSIKTQEYDRARYENLDGLRYCRVRLLNRRAAAMYRRRKRHLPMEG